MKFKVVMRALQKLVLHENYAACLGYKMKARNIIILLENGIAAHQIFIFIME
jgi:hypothetical protein